MTDIKPQFHEFRNILQQSSHLQQSVRKVTRGTQDFNIQGDQQHHVSEDAYATSKVRRYNVCTCRETVQTAGNESISFLHFIKIFRQYHYRGCPKSTSSVASLEYLVKIVPPNWLLSHTLSLGFFIQFWNSKSSWKIPPFIFGGSRRIDRSRAPAFRAIQQLRKTFYLDYTKQPTPVKELERTLKDLFHSHQASVYDEDHLGNTLFFVSDAAAKFPFQGYANITQEVMDLYVWRVRVPHHPYAQDFVSLIQFLLDSGSDPNIRRRVSHKEFFGSSLDLGGGTVLDVFAIPLRCQEPIFRNDCPTRPLVFRKLLDSDACFSRPLSESRKRKHGYFHFKNLEKVMDKVEAFEEQFEGIWLTRASRSSLKCFI